MSRLIAALASVFLCKYQPVFPSFFFFPFFFGLLHFHSSLVSLSLWNEPWPDYLMEQITAWEYSTHSMNTLKYTACGCSLFSRLRYESQSDKVKDLLRLPTLWTASLLTISLETPPTCELFNKIYLWMNFWFPLFKYRYLPNTLIE